MEEYIYFSLRIKYLHNFFVHSVILSHKYTNLNKVHGFTKGSRIWNKHKRNYKENDIQVLDLIRHPIPIINRAVRHFTNSMNQVGVPGYFNSNDG